MKTKNVTKPSVTIIKFKHLPVGAYFKRQAENEVYVKVAKYIAGLLTKTAMKTIISDYSQDLEVVLVEIPSIEYITK